MNINKVFIHYFTMNRKKLVATLTESPLMSHFSYSKIIDLVFFLTKKRFSVLYFRFAYS